MTDEPAKLVSPVQDGICLHVSVGSWAWSVRTQRFEYTPPFRSEWDHWEKNGWKLEGAFR